MTDDGRKDGEKRTPYYKNFDPMNIYMLGCREGQKYPTNLLSRSLAKANLRSDNLKMTEL